MKKRKMFIDIARGLALLLVVISHSNILNVHLNTFINSFYIPVFFFISGYMYVVSNLEKKDYLKSKIKKIIIPYFTYSFIILLFFTCLNGISNIVLHTSGIFYSRFCLFPYNVKSNIYFLDIGSAPLWFLTSYIVTVILFNFIMKLNSEKKVNGITIFIIGFLGTIILKQLPILLPWSIDTTLLMAIFMYAGYLSKEKNIFETLLNSRVMIISMILLSLIVSFINGPTNISVRDYGNSLILYIIGGFVGSLILLKLSIYLENIKFLGNNIINYIGKNTIVILAFHLMGFYAIDIVTNILFDVDKFANIEFIAYTLIKIILSVVGCCLLNEIINMIKQKIVERRV